MDHLMAIGHLPSCLFITAGSIYPN